MKKRYFLIPLIVLGVMIIIAPFALRVKMASDNQQQQEQEDNNNNDRSINEQNMVSYGTYSSNPCREFYFLINDDIINNTGYLLQFDGSNHTSYIQVTSTQIDIYSNYSRLAYYLKSNLDIGNCLYVTLNYTNNVLKVSVYIYKYNNGWQPTTIISNTTIYIGSTTNGYYNSATMHERMNYSSGHTFQFNDELLYPYDVNVVNYNTNDSSLYINYSINNGYSIMPYYDIWQDDSLNAEYNLLILNVDNFDFYYTLDIQPNYVESHVGRIKLVMRNDELGTETIIDSISDITNKYFYSLYLIHDSQNHFYFNLGIMECEVNDYGQFSFDEVDLLESSSITIDSINFENCVCGRIDMTNITTDQYRYIADQTLRNQLNITYLIGYENGLNGETAISPFVNLMTQVFGGVNQVLSLQILPGIKLWYFIAIPMFFIVLFTILKIWKHN